MTTTLVCQHCGHGTDPRRPWLKRLPGGMLPLRCPVCGSPNWDKPQPVAGEKGK